jgi:MarR family transcriptional regulator, organic hydroperoxide resistance regulator
MRTDDHELILLIARTTFRIREATRQVLAPYDLQRPQNLVLDALAEQDGLTPGEIAARLEVSGPTAVKMTQRMEANGVVERRRDDPDGRLVRVYLTKRGREIQGPIQREIDRIAERAVAGVNAPSRETLRRSLETIRANLGATREPARAATRATP